MDQACEIRRGGNKLKQNERQPADIMEERSWVRNCGGRQGQTWRAINRYPARKEYVNLGRSVLFPTASKIIPISAAERRGLSNEVN
jgi:hypothetical protein